MHLACTRTNMIQLVDEGRSCCICLTELSNKDKKKVINYKLNGMSAAGGESKRILADIIDEIYHVKFDDTQLCRSKICICHKCTTELQSIKSLYAKRATLVDRLCPYVPEGVGLHTTMGTMASSGCVATAQAQPSPAHSRGHKRSRSVSSVTTTASPSQYLALHNDSHGDEVATHTSPRAPCRARVEKRRPSGVAVSASTYIHVCLIITYM